MKDGGFGRVEVFGLFVAQHARAKADDFAFDRADGEHDAVAKAVIPALWPAFAFASNHQAAFHQQRIGVVGKNARQRAPAFGRVAQGKAAGDLAGEAAFFQVADGARRFFQALAVGLAGARQHLRERGAALALLRVARFFLRAARVFGHGQAALLGQLVHGLGKARAGVLHQKVDGVAMLAAAEAVIELFGGADAERGRFLGVKRAQAHEIGAAFFQLHVAAHHLHHVGAGQQLLNE